MATTSRDQVPGPMGLRPQNATGSWGPRSYIYFFNKMIDSCANESDSILRSLILESAGVKKEL